MQHSAVHVWSRPFAPRHRVLTLACDSPSRDPPPLALATVVAARGDRAASVAAELAKGKAYVRGTARNGARLPVSLSALMAPADSLAAVLPLGVLPCYK